MFVPPLPKLPPLRHYLSLRASRINLASTLSITRLHVQSRHREPGQVSIHITPLILLGHAPSVRWDFTMDEFH
jgi:hypothetical protein